MALTQTIAEGRFACLKQNSIAYRFHLALYPGKKYQGFGEMEFSLSSVPEDLTLDCKAQIAELFINKVQLKQFRHEGGFLYLPSSSLKEGNNNIAVFYESTYDNDGNGLVSFIDTADGDKQYLYTQFEPYYATRVFPCFDQPDLKATMELSIFAPKDWEILSNEYSTFQQGGEEFGAAQYVKNNQTFHQNLLENFAKDVLAKSKNFSNKHLFQLTIFPKTKMLPTYLYCFVAGPYQRYQLPKEQQHNNIPMSLYCMSSLYNYMVDLAPFIFEITIESLKFFEEFFGVPYSFNKYDQVFAHEYKAGAMENAGIVTFRDQYIFKEKVSTQRMLRLAITISHELSHHWFGNLVTMKWWDDLWLNESFADFISHYCLEEIKGKIKTINYDSCMTTFVNRKASGYREDELVTTHPIRADVPNTIVADLIFDMITYAKGASTMQQLLFLMGKKNFSAGLKDHFKRYGFKNATLEQFMAELQRHFESKELSLEEWKKYWLETSSFNILTPFWNPQGHSNCEKMTIVNKPLKAEYPTIRPHKIMIALFKEDCSFDVIEAFVKPQEETIIEYDGSKQYKAVLLNYGDQTFARISFDKHSRSFFAENVNKIDDVLTRILIWKNFYDAVYSAKEPSTNFIDLFCRHIASEKSDAVFEKQFENAKQVISNYTPRKYREQLNTRVFYFVLSLIPKVDQSQKNRLIVLRQKLCDFASAEISVKILLAWREGKYEPLKNHKITLGQQWTAVKKAFAQKGISLQEKEELLESQLKIDPSDGGNLQRALCDSLKANKEQFEELYISFKDPKNERSVTLKEYMAAGWNHPYHVDRLKQYKQQYFKDVVETSSILEGDHYEFFVDSLLPIDEDYEETISSLKAIKLPNEDKFDKVKTDIRKYIDKFERRVATYACFEGEIN